MAEFRRRSDAPYFSKSQLDAARKNAVGWMLDKYVGKYGGIENPFPDEAELGSDLHRGMQHSFEALRKLKEDHYARNHGVAPTQTQTAEMLDIAYKNGISAMKYDQIKEKERFIRENLKDIGEQFLQNEQDKILVETQVESASSMMKYRYGGRLDLLHWDDKTKTLVVADWKDHGDFMFGDYGSKEALTKDTATSVYATAAYDMVEEKLGIKKSDIKNVAVEYRINNKALQRFKSKMQLEERSAFTAVRITMDPAQLENARKKNEELVRTVDTHITNIELAKKLKGETGVLDYIFEMKQKGECHPSKLVCGNCPLAFVCHESQVMFDPVLANENAANAQGLRQAGINDPEAIKLSVDPMVAQRQRFLDAKRAHAVSEYRRSYAEQFPGRSGTVDEATALYERGLAAAHTEELTRYRTELETFSYRNPNEGRLYTSVFDDRFRPWWIDRRMQGAIKSHMYSYISAFAESTGFNYVNNMMPDIIDKAGSSKRMVGALHDSLMRGAAKYLEGKGVHLTRDNINSEPIQNMIKRTVMSYNHTLDKSFVDALHTELDQQFISSMMKYDRARLEQYIGPEELKELNRKRDLQGIVGKVKSATGFASSGMADNAKIATDIAGGRSYDSLLAKYSLSRSSRFPFAAGAAAAALTYMTATIQAFNQQENQYRKAAESQSQPREVADAHHGGLLSTVWRLVSSDFGSAFRSIVNVSGIISKLAADAGETIKKTKFADAMGEFIANRKASVSDLVKGNRSQDELNRFLGKSDATFIVAAAASAAGYLFLSNLPTTQETTQEIEQRQARFKKLKETRWNNKSQTFVPTSDLRREYKLQTPFGSPLLLRSWHMVSRLIEKIPVGAFVDDLAKNIRPERYVTKGLFTIGREESQEVTSVLASSAQMTNNRGRVARVVAQQSGERDLAGVGNILSQQSRTRAMDSRELIPVTRSIAADYELEREATRVGQRSLLSDNIADAVTKKPRSIEAAYPEFPGRSTKQIPVTRVRTRSINLSNIPTGVPKGNTTDHAILTHHDGSYSVVINNKQIMPTFNRPTLDTTEVLSPPSLYTTTGTVVRLKQRQQPTIMRGSYSEPGIQYMPELGYSNMRQQNAGLHTLNGIVMAKSKDRKMNFRSNELPNYYY